MSGYEPSDYERRQLALELAFREQHDKGPSAPLDVIGRAAEFEDYLQNGSGVKPVDRPAQPLSPEYGSNPMLGDPLQRMYAKGRSSLRFETDFGTVAVHITPPR